MALKDLLVSKAVLAEEAIEKIVAGHVHYDAEAKEITLSHAGAALPAKKKLLVYLVALQGWPYVVSEEPIPTDASPAELVEQLGVPGGTIRPMLMDLADRHLAVNRNGRYSVRASSLHAITAELEAGGSAGDRPKKRPAASRAKAEGGKAPPTNRRDRSGKRRSQAAMFENWIDQGFFDQPRSQADVVKKFRQAGIIVSRTSMPQLFLKAIRADRLVREEADVSGRNVWVYRRPK